MAQNETTRIKGYMAPMEGLTGHIFRNAYHRVFMPMDKYFTPFISPGRERSLRTREKRDILPENNQGLPVVPQLLANQADVFLRTCEELSDMGYREVNLNLGCPSATVTSKYKGAGFLAKPEELDRFLDEVFAGCPLAISVKTRLGVESVEEFPTLLAIFEQYPISELILHPRLQKEFYRGKPHRDTYGEMLAKSRLPMVFNGNLFRVEDICETAEKFPRSEALMLGRGLLCNPTLWNQYHGRPASKRDVEEFHGILYEEYQTIMEGDRNLLFRMKEHWYYMRHLFTNEEKYVKKLRKVQRKQEYEALVKTIFQQEELTFSGFRPPN